MSYRLRLNEVRLRAGVTDKEWDALSLWDSPRVGYRAVGLALGIAPETARGRIQRATRKLAALDPSELL